jgi:hypothetical protein
MTGYCAEIMRFGRWCNEIRKLRDVLLEAAINQSITNTILPVCALDSSIAWASFAFTKGNVA